MAEFPTSRGSWPWPWIGSYCIPSCISRRPLPTQRISLKSKNVFVDGQTDVRAEGHLRPTILGRLRGVDIKIWKHVRALYAESRKKVQDNENDIKALKKLQSIWHSLCHSPFLTTGLKILTCNTRQVTNDKRCNDILQERRAARSTVQWKEFVSFKPGVKARVWLVVKVATEYAKHDKITCKTRRVCKKKLEYGQK